MTKTKKKRNKSYRGHEAKATQPNIVRISAVQRSPLGQWWHDKKRFAKPALIAAAVAGGVGILIFEIIKMLAG